VISGRPKANILRPCYGIIELLPYEKNKKWAKSNPKTQKLKPDQQPKKSKKDDGKVSCALSYFFFFPSHLGLNKSKVFRALTKKRERRGKYVRKVGNASKSQEVGAKLN